jgi:glycosyltransferase involved in cell wall biosynthesis
MHNKHLKVILSTFGPLHLTKSAEFLAHLVDICVIQGWIPCWCDRFLLKIASRIIGRDLSKSFKKRIPDILNKRNFGIALPEFYMWFCRCFLHKSAAISSAKLYGFMSKRFIKDADIFHVRSGSGLGGAIEKAKQKGMKVVVDHSAAHPIFAEKQLKDEYKRNNVVLDMGISVPFWKQVLRDCEKADVLLVNSDFVKKTFIQNGYDKEKIRVSYLGVRRDFFGIKSNYEKIDGKIKILYTGSFRILKGKEYILKAAKELYNRNIDCKFIIVGDNDEVTQKTKKIKQENIKLIGHVLQDELKKYLATSDIYLFPSLCDGCASSGMEAMAAGLPVIATVESGLPIENRRNGIIIPSKDVNAIVDAIIKLKDDKELREKLGTAATRTISKNYTWEQYSQKTFNVYNELLINEES